MNLQGLFDVLDLFFTKSGGLSDGSVAFGIKEWQ